MEVAKTQFLVIMLFTKRGFIAEKMLKDSKDALREKSNILEEYYN